MRRARAVVLAALVVLAACSGGDDDDDDDDDREASGSATALSAEDAQAIVDGALLDAGDLGEGWELSSTIPADEEEPTPADECVGEDDVDNADLAESEERRFTGPRDAVVAPEVGISAGAATDPATLARIHDVLADTEVQSCLRDTFQSTMGEGGLEIGEPTFAEGIVVGVDVEVESSRLTMPMVFGTGSGAVHAVVELVYVTAGQVGAGIFAFGLDGAITDEQLTDWATEVAGRLTGPVS